MKAICILVLFIALISCKKEELSNAEQFVRQVENNEYIKEYLPSLSSEDITVLLYHANNYNRIDNFPTNPASSFPKSEYTVGECLLWTIENIRLHYGDYSDYKFPSLVPKLWQTDVDERFISEEQLNEAVELYKNWWNSNSDKDFETIRTINPLEGSNYFW